MAWTLFGSPAGFKTITGMEPLIQDAIDNQGRQLHILLKCADDTSVPTVDEVNIYRDGEHADSANWPLLTFDYTVKSAGAAATLTALLHGTRCRIVRGKVVCPRK